MPQSISGLSTAIQVSSDVDVGGQVGGGVEALRQHAIHVGSDQRRSTDGHTVGAVQLQVIYQRRKRLVVARQLDASSAGIDVGAPQIEVGDLVVDTSVDDGVEHLGEQQRVHDVAGQLDGLRAHMLL